MNALSLSIIAPQTCKQPKCSPAAEWINDVVEPHNWIWCQQWKEQITDAHKNSAKLESIMLRERSQTKRYHTVWKHSDEILEKVQLIYSYKKINGCLGLGTGDFLIAKRNEELLGVKEVFQILIMVALTWLYTFVTTYQTLYLKCMHFIVGNLYPNKSNF